MLQSTSKIALAPNGNGGVYAGRSYSIASALCSDVDAPFVAALHKSKALADMKRRGVEHVHVYGVDNVRAALTANSCDISRLVFVSQVLVKIADPSFIGFVAERKVDCANKVVLRVRAQLLLDDAAFRHFSAFVLADGPC
jgi:UDP-N-acetylglucosamine/UDP-N-acetylgalactosamine diphosphorylase